MRCIVYADTFFPIALEITSDRRVTLALLLFSQRLCKLLTAQAVNFPTRPILDLFSVLLDYWSFGTSSNGSSGIGTYFQKLPNFSTALFAVILQLL